VTRLELASGQYDLQRDPRLHMQPQVAIFGSSRSLRCPCPSSSQSSSGAWTILATSRGTFELPYCTPCSQIMKIEYPNGSWLGRFGSAELLGPGGTSGARRDFWGRQSFRAGGAGGAARTAELGVTVARKKAPGRLPQGHTRIQPESRHYNKPRSALSRATNLAAFREAGGATRCGDRLDKAGQPGGPVSAVY
jgi:hypothetical protein